MCLYLLFALYWLHMLEIVSAPRLLAGFKNRTMINSVSNVYASDKNKLVFLYNSNKTN